MLPTHPAVTSAPSQALKEVVAGEAEQHSSLLHSTKVHSQLTTGACCHHTHTWLYTSGARASLNTHMHSTAVLAHKTFRMHGQDQLRLPHFGSQQVGPVAPPHCGNNNSLPRCNSGITNSSLTNTHTSSHITHHTHPAVCTDTSMAGHCWVQLLANALIEASCCQDQAERVTCEFSTSAAVVQGQCCCCGSWGASAQQQCQPLVWRLYLPFQTVVERRLHSMPPGMRTWLSWQAVHTRLPMLSVPTEHTGSSSGRGQVRDRLRVRV